MTKSVQYFSRDGSPLSEDEAHDRRGILRDGVRMRTSVTMLDHFSPPPRSERGASLVTDSTGGSSFHKPGFRFQMGDEIALHEKERAYEDHRRALSDAWKTTHYDPKNRVVGTSISEEDDPDDDDKRKNSDTALADAYQSHNDYITNAYKTPAGCDGDPSGSGITGFGAHQFVGARVGDICMTNSRERGHLKKINGELVCVADRASTDSHSVAKTMADHRATMQSLYAEHASALAEAWRNP